MSSILKALKKLETGDLLQTRESETDPAENRENFSYPRKNDIKKTIRQQAAERHILNVLVSVAATILIVFGGMWLFLSRKPAQVQTILSQAISVRENAAVKSQDPAVSEKRDGSIPPMQKKSAEISFPKKPDPEIKTETQEPAVSFEKKDSLSELTVKNISEPKKAGQFPPKFEATLKPDVGKSFRLPEKTLSPWIMPISQSNEPEKSRRNMTSTVRAESEKAVRVSEKAVHESSAKKIREPEKRERSGADIGEPGKSELGKAMKSPEKTVSASEPASGKSSESEKISPRPTEPERAKEIDDPRLKLQALVWSGNPEKRLAVVNDRIVKTGGFITDTITVTYIGSDYIAVQEGNKEWEVKFKIK